jgi:hypothetical protein
MKHLWIVPFGVDPGLVDTMNPALIQFDEGDPGAFKKIEDEGDPPSAILSLSMARHLDLRKGSLMNLSFRLGSEKGDIRVRVAAVVASLPGFPNFRARAGNAQGSGLLLSRRIFDRMTKSAPREAFDGFALVRAQGTGGRRRPRSATASRSSTGWAWSARKRRSARRKCSTG